MDHSQVIFALAHTLPVRDVYIEFGVQFGSTFRLLAPLFKRAIAVDIVDCPVRDVGEMFVMPSSQFWAEQPQVVADMIFVDADHSHEASLNDAYHALACLRPYTGLLVMHDTYPDNADQLSPRYSGDSWRTAGIIRETMNRWGNVESVTLPGMHGITIARGIPSGQHLHWADNAELLRLSLLARA